MKTLFLGTALLVLLASTVSCQRHSAQEPAALQQQQQLQQQLQNNPNYQIPTAPNLPNVGSGMIATPPSDPTPDPVPPVDGNSVDPAVP
jgi:hypothetical protein